MNKSIEAVLAEAEELISQRHVNVAFDNLIGLFQQCSQVDLKRLVFLPHSFQSQRLDGVGRPTLGRYRRRHFVIEPATGQVVEHLTKANAGLPSNSVEALAIDPQTLQPFIGTYDVALALRSPNGQWQPIEYPQSIRNQAGSNMLLTYCIEFDNEGRLWAGISVGLARFADGEWTLFNQSTGHSMLNGVWSMAKTADGAILAASHLMYRVQGPYRR